MSRFWIIKVAGDDEPVLPTMEAPDAVRAAEEFVESQTAEGTFVAVPIASATWFEIRLGLAILEADDETEETEAA